MLLTPDQLNALVGSLAQVGIGLAALLVLWRALAQNSEQQRGLLKVIGEMSAQTSLLRQAIESANATNRTQTAEIDTLALKVEATPGKVSEIIIASQTPAFKQALSDHQDLKDNDVTQLRILTDVSARIGALPTTDEMKIALRDGFAPVMAKFSNIEFLVTDAKAALQTAINQTIATAQPPTPQLPIIVNVANATDPAAPLAPATVEQRSA